ncbi:hypothetical protein MRX96_046253 [Rhipicephalus microplus]
MDTAIVHAAVLYGVLCARKRGCTGEPAAPRRAVPRHKEQIRLADSRAARALLFGATIPRRCCCYTLPPSRTARACDTYTPPRRFAPRSQPSALEIKPSVDDGTSLEFIRLDESA